MPELPDSGKKADIALSINPVRFALLIFSLTMLLFIIMSAIVDADRALASMGYGLLTAALVSFAAGGIGCLSNRAVLLGCAAIFVTVLATTAFVLDDHGMFDSEEALSMRITMFLVTILCTAVATLAAASWGWYKYLVLARRDKGSDKGHDVEPPGS